jgi:predicted O-methyltransferase YrrM
MTALNDPRLKETLADLHGRADGDWRVFARALPSVAWGALRGRGAVESAKPFLKHAYIPIDAAQGRALYQIVRATGAQRVVEFGTSFGVSTLYLAAAVRDNGGGEVITTELEPGKIAAARANFVRARMDDLIDLRAGDALQTLQDAPWPVDLVFLDGWKEMCLPVLKLVEPKLRPNAVVLCDDMKRFRKTLQPLVDHLRHPSGHYTSMALPLGDELEFAVYRPPDSSASARAHAAE